MCTTRADGRAICSRLPLLTKACLTDKDPHRTAARAAQLFAHVELGLTLKLASRKRQPASRNRRMASRTTSLILRLSWSAMRRMAS
jgi:hypothetical protein